VIDDTLRSQIGSLQRRLQTSVEALDHGWSINDLESKARYARAEPGALPLPLPADAACGVIVLEGAVCIEGFPTIFTAGQFTLVPTQHAVRHVSSVTDLATEIIICTFRMPGDHAGLATQ
jgi:hypothetical protein